MVHKPKRRNRHTPQPVQTGEPVDAPGVTYFEVIDAAGLKFFHCGPHGMTLSTRGCGKRWAAAQTLSGESAEAAYACRSCPIGASHAGAEFVSSSRLFGAKICPRCRIGATRIIGDRVCVSCYNREREMVSGRNARGNAPTEVLKRPLRTVDFVLSVDGVSRRHRVERVVDHLEAVLQIMRTTKGRVVFAPIAPEPEIRQRDLFLAAGLGCGAPGYVRRRRRGARRERIVVDQAEFWPQEAA